MRVGRVAVTPGCIKDIEWHVNQSISVEFCKPHNSSCLWHIFRAPSVLGERTYGICCTTEWSERRAMIREDNHCSRMDHISPHHQAGETLEQCWLSTPTRLEWMEGGRERREGVWQLAKESAEGKPSAVMHDHTETEGEALRNQPQGHSSMTLFLHHIPAEI